MKTTSPRIIALTAIAALAPAFAQAHPGHSALDFTAGMPHAGHEHELATIMLFLGLSAFLVGVRWLANRRG